MILNIPEGVANVSKDTRNDKTDKQNKKKKPRANKRVHGCNIHV